MTGIMVSASTGAMNSLLGKLTTLMGEQFAKMKNLRKEVKFIRDEFGSMKDALERLADVDEPDPRTKRWRNTLRELSYDIEDIIDDFIQNIGDKDKKSGFVRKTIRRLKTSRARHRIAGQIEEIKKLVHETSDRHRRYDLDKIIPQSSNVVAIDPRVKTLYEKAANLVGMEGPKNELVDWLTDEEKHLKVVSVVGFGGLGKTTLANEVYRRLKGDFAYGAFVPVSQTPNIPNLLRSLLSQLGTQPPIDACDSHLIDKLRECLQTKRYLIIIDDLWDVSAWEFIKCAFPENDLASRVIVTTRILEVATACCSPHHEYILQMKPLSNEDSRKLFFGRIFGSDICPNHLRDVSAEILNKCGGLPLAIISIAGLLASEGPKEEEWEHVRNSLGSMSGTKLTLNGMRQILNLSYKDLPSHLKTCLLYLAMYPEDYTIKRTDLERQWMAEGFISKENGQDMEKNARNYFNELINRSLVQPVEFHGVGAVTACKVHDMMLDLILLKCKEENFLSIVDGSEAITEQEYKVRRLSVRLNDSDNGILLGNISLSQVRSFMIFGHSGKTPPLSKFKFLRVLFVKDHNTMDLTGMSELYQLRYVMAGTGDGLQLPRQIRGLQQLETLDIRNSSIPSDIVHLPHLSHLGIGYACKLPDGIGKMKSLRFLRAFNLEFERNSLDNYKGLGELTNMRNLSLSGDFEDEDAGVRRMDVLCSSLRKLCRLESLYIDNIQGCMDGLSPPCSLQRLHGRGFDLQDCWFSRVPKWTRELHNLRELHLQVDELLDDGVGILGGLPSLIDLDLRVRRSPKEMIIINGRGVFPVLKRFDMGLSRASYLIFQSGAMPMVQRLSLIFNIDVQKQNGAGPAGIEHLAALEEVSAWIVCIEATEPQKSCAESDFRSIVDRHPDNPRTVVRLCAVSLFIDD